MQVMRFYLNPLPMLKLDVSSEIVNQPPLDVTLLETLSSAVHSMFFLARIQR